jgi:2Fe-2S ferredoxin
MPRLNFVRPSGERVAVDSTEDNVMRAALANGIYEISGECGGVLACATCHVYVDPAYLDRLPAMSEDENEMLDFAVAPRRENSRLGCQIPLTAETDGITVTVGAAGEEG